MSKAVGAWPTGLCDCFADCGTCCCGFWCTPCLFGDNAKRLGHSYWGNCLLFWLFGGCCSCCFTSNREQLRTNHSLPAAPCSDCMVMCCCPGCAVCQEARVLKTYGPAPQFEQGYPQQAGYAAPPTQHMA